MFKAERTECLKCLTSIFLCDTQTCFTVEPYVLDKESIEGGDVGGGGAGFGG